MRGLLTAALFLGLTVPAPAADDAATAAKKLEGTYEVVSLTVGGKPDPKVDQEKPTVTIKDGTLVIAFGGKKDDTAKFTLDPSKKPAEIDITPGRGPAGAGKVLGVYEAKESDKGLELTIAFARDSMADRPKDFKGEGERATVLKLLRKKDK